jgi:exodeoxyribonuclease-3
MLSIVTWNVNSIKSRLSICLDYLKKEQPDVLLLQEIKTVNDTFPYMEIEELGYNTSIHGQKTYNGVAIFSKYPIEDVITCIDGNEDDEQARYIEGVISVGEEVIRIASVYVPNGNAIGSEKFAYKMKFFDLLQKHIASRLQYEEKFIIGGDYNVAPDDEAVYDEKKLAGSICFHSDEQKKYRSLLNLGLTDAFEATNDNLNHFTWWDYRGSSWKYNKGMRIDHLLLSPQAADTLESSEIHDYTRDLEKPSDHAPVICRLLIG